MKKRLLGQLPLLALVVVGGVAVAQSIDNTGRDIAYSGRLELHGAPLSGAVDMRFDLYASATATSTCATREVSDVGVANGAFSLVIPDVPDGCLLGGELWFDLAVGEAGSGTLSPLSSAGGGRTRITSVPFATAVPKSSSFLVGSGEIALDDPESGAVYTLKGSDDVSPDHGVALRAHTNPPSGEPLFRVLSSGGAERLRVEHDGDVEIDNGIVVSGSAAIAGDVSADGVVSASGVSAQGNVAAQGDVVAQGDVRVNGRLHLSEVVTNGNGSSGCKRMGDVMECWGTSVEGTGGNQRVYWEKSFANGSYAVTCTVYMGDSTSSRAATIRGRYADRVHISVLTPNHNKQDEPAFCIAIGKGGTW